MALASDLLIFQRLCCCRSLVMQKVSFFKSSVAAVYADPALLIMIRTSTGKSALRHWRGTSMLQPRPE